MPQAEAKKSREAIARWWTSPRIDTPIGSRLRNQLWLKRCASTKVQYQIPFFSICDTFVGQMCQHIFWKMRILFNNDTNSELRRIFYEQWTNVLKNKCKIHTEHFDIIWQTFSNIHRIFLKNMVNIFSNVIWQFFYTRWTFFLYIVNIFSIHVAHLYYASIFFAIGWTFSKCRFPNIFFE